MLALTAAGCPGSQSGNGGTSGGSDTEQTGSAEAESADQKQSSKQVSERKEVSLRLENRGEIEPRETSELVLSVRDGKRRYLGTLNPVWNRQAHLFIYSRDLMWFSHLVPEVRADGSITQEIRFPSPGQFVLHLVVRPDGVGEPLHLTENLELPGRNPSESFPQQNLSDQVSPEISATLDPASAPAANTEIDFTMEVTRSPEGSPTELAQDPPEPMHLGEVYGDRLFISAMRYGNEPYFFQQRGDDLITERGDNNFTANLPLEFPRPGKWKVWVEFGFGGERRVASFVVQVAG